jgi:hypothetical protein
MSEKSCIVSLNSEQAKYKILNNPGHNTGFLWHLHCWESCIFPVHCLELQYRISLTSGLLRILYFSCSLFRVTIQNFSDIWIVENLVFCLFTVSSYNIEFLCHLHCWESCILPVHCLELQYRISMSSGLILYLLSILLFPILLKYPHV